MFKTSMLLIMINRIATKNLLYIICFFPLISKSQTKTKKLHPLVKKDWFIIKALDINDTTNVLYDLSKNTKKWDLKNTFIYALDKNQVGIMNILGVDVGIIDSVSSNRFIVTINYPNGSKSFHEYSEIKITKSLITYTFRRWDLSSNGDSKYLQYGYYATCKPSKKVIAKPTFKEIEKKRGNRINYEFTTDNGKPLKEKRIDINIVMKGYQIQSWLFTDSLGKATAYYPDYYFESNNSIIILIKQGNLKSSIMLEKKYCPATIKRALSDKEDMGNKIEIRKN